MKDSYVTKITPTKIVHTSAMYYQNLNVIHYSGERLLMIKSVKWYILHLVPRTTTITLNEYMYHTLLSIF